MKLYKLVFLFLILSIWVLPNEIQAQGCVAIRHFSCGIGNEPESNILRKGDVLLGMNYRYFKSFRHFKGTEEEPDRVANNTEVINYAHSWDFILNYGITNRLFASIILPVVLNERSSLYEHGREERNKTFSRGLADVRIGMGYWLFEPGIDQKGNLSLGVGLKLPTGNYNATDIFYNVGPESSPQVRPVDQSIQPGDGGFGFTTNLQFYKSLSTKLFLYGGGFYLFNPKETNGIRTFRETLSPVLLNEAIMSVPDQFSANAGFGFNFSQSISATMGARYEGVPVEDVFGESGGFRRPGNVLSLDPGISYGYENLFISLNVPVALRRERPQSVTDRETQIATGNPRNGDAAFADYLINFGISYRIPAGKSVEKFKSDLEYNIN